MKLRQVVLQVLWIFPSLAFKQDYLRFPPGLSIGAATAAYQIEGGWNASDKGISTWDFFTHQKPSPIADSSTGDIACDSYHKYKEDVVLLKNIGLDYYRLSVSWTRILPNGFSNKISKDGIQYYKNLIDELRSKGIEPYVTIYHWDHPAFMDRFGSWTNELMVEYFADYARVVFRELGDKVKFWTTINEGTLYCARAYGGKELAPALDLPYYGEYLCVHNMLKAHARAYHIYNDEFRSKQKGHIGLTLPCYQNYPADKNDKESARIAFEFDCGWMAHPIFSKEGDYPKIMKTRIAENSKLQGSSRSRLPEFSKFWINYIRGTADYFGLNHYTSIMVKSVPRVKGTLWYQDSGLKKFPNASWPETSLDELWVVPKGIRDGLIKLKETYNNPPIYILENGATFESGINDHLRTSFLHAYMKQVFLAAHEDGVNVRGYTIWSLLDNFQWNDGYTKPFGLVQVNFNHPDRTRTLRLSGKWLTEVIRRRKLFAYPGVFQKSYNFLGSIFIMELIGILFISTLVYVANGEATTFQVENAASPFNQYIAIDQDNHGRVERTRIRQIITDGDDWNINYKFRDDEKELESGTGSFCNPRRRSTAASIVDLTLKVLSVKDRHCPIKMQTVNHPSAAVKGDIDIDGYDNDKKIHIEISLMKSNTEIVGITLSSEAK